MEAVDDVLSGYPGLQAAQEALAELDALPIAEDTGVDYASTVTTTGPDGRSVPVAHACGHDLHMACLLAAVRLLANRRARWSSTLLALFQPAEETAAGVPYTYWGIGRTDRQAYLTAETAGRLQDLPSNRSPKFLPPLQPTLRTGTEALAVAAMAWLAPH